MHYYCQTRIQCPTLVMIRAMCSQQISKNFFKVGYSFQFVQLNILHAFNSRMFQVNNKSVPWGVGISNCISLVPVVYVGVH